MGKRELLLVATFLVIGVLAWRLTAPSGTAGGGVSIGQLISQARSAMRGERVGAPLRLTATAVPGEAARTVLVEDFAGDVSVVGEDRAEASAELRGSIYGVDEADSQARLAQVAVRFTEAGDVVRVTLSLPEARQRRPSLELRLTVPARLAVKLARVRGDVEVRGVAAAELDTRSGDLSVSDVEGAVRAEHRGGQVEFTRVGSVTCEIRMGDLRVTDVRGALECETEGGRFEARGIAGTTRVESKRTDLDFEHLAGAVTIEAEDGRVVLREQRAPLTFTGDRGRLLLTLAAPVEARITAEDATVEVSLAKGVGAAADLEVEDGALRLPEPLQPTSTKDNQHAFTGALAGGGKPLVVRSRRGDIIVRD